MSLMKRGNVWWAYFYIDGVRYQRSTGTANRREAEGIARQLREDAAAMGQGTPKTDPRLTFGDLAARFIATEKPKPYHLERIKQLLPYFEAMPLVKISKGHVREYRKYRHRRRKLTEATVNRDVSVLRHLLYWAVDEFLLPLNPLARIRMPRERPKRRPVVSLAEERRILDHAPAHLRDMVIASLDSGMRKGEILGQRWEQVDFDRRLLYVTRSKTAQGESREIPLTTRLFDLLVEIRQPQGPVFRYESRSVHHIRRSWLATLKRAGVRHLRFHDLRHAFNTRLMEAGVLQEVRMALMGHVNPQQVHATYTHVELPTKRKAIQKLEAWMERKTQNLQEDDDDYQG